MIKNKQRDYIKKKDREKISNNKKFSHFTLYIARIVNFVLIRYFKIKITPILLNGRPEEYNYHVDKDRIKIINLELTDKISEIFNRIKLKRNKSKINLDILEFQKLFRKISDFDLQGGMGYNNALFLFCFCRATNSSMFIESGVYRGFTTKIIDAASDKDAKINCFDIDLSLLKYKSKKATYFNNDIFDCKFGVTKNTTALFDDHFSHYDRLQFCLKKKIKYLVFDDDVSINAIHSDGMPPIPTVNMIMNYNKIPHKFKWVSNNSEFQMNISKLETENIIYNYNYIQIPDLFEYTGYRNTSSTSLLVLK